MTAQQEEYARIGENIRKLRTENELSQEKLAEKVEVDRSYIGFLERGQKNPTINTLYKIAKALNVKLKDLFE